MNQPFDSRAIRQLSLDNPLDVIHNFYEIFKNSFHCTIFFSDSAGGGKVSDQFITNKQLGDAMRRWLKVVPGTPTFSR